MPSSLLSQRSTVTVRWDGLAVDDRLAAYPVRVLAVEPCGTITDVRFNDSAPEQWHSFSSSDLVAILAY